MIVAWFVGLGLIVAEPSDSGQSSDRVVQVSLTEFGEVDVAVVVNRLAEATGTRLEPLQVSVELPTTSRSRPLTIQYLTEALKPDVRVELSATHVSFLIGPDPANVLGSVDWERRLVALAGKAKLEAERQARYGFRRRPSYRPNDPFRPSVCLLHGLNSTSVVFKHLIPALEDAGYGVVTYDFPYNRDLDETSANFAQDWARFRQQQGGAWSLGDSGALDGVAPGPVDGGVGQSG